MLQLSGEGKAREIYGNGLQSASGLLWRFAVPPSEDWEERLWGWHCVPVTPACPSACDGKAKSKGAKKLQQMWARPPRASGSPLCDMLGHRLCRCLIRERAVASSPPKKPLLDEGKAILMCTNLAGKMPVLRNTVC